jgi:hypothetical protein
MVNPKVAVVLHTRRYSDKYKWSKEENSTILSPRVSIWQENLAKRLKNYIFGKIVFLNTNSKFLRLFYCSKLWENCF